MSTTDAAYVLAPLDDDGGRWRARMFAPALGITEDPATGAAAAAVAGHLAGCNPPGRRYAWTIEQGVEMGRPSRIDVSATIDSARVVAVHVAGPAVVVGSGTLAV